MACAKWWDGHDFSFVCAYVRTRTHEVIKEGAKVS